MSAIGEFLDKRGISLPPPIRSWIESIPEDAQRGAVQQLSSRSNDEAATSIQATYAQMRTASAAQASQANSNPTPAIEETTAQSATAGPTPVIPGNFRRIGGAAKKVAGGVGGQLKQESVWGMPLWATLLMAVITIVALRSALNGRVGNILPTLPTGETVTVPTQPDTEGLLEIGGVVLPIKTEAIPNLPFVSASAEQIAIGAMIVSAIVLTWLDNSQPRPNQAPARRANWGILIYFLGIFAPGWWPVVFATAGTILARRPRSGAIMRPWPYIIGTILFLYVWFDLIAPMVPQLLAWIGAFAPWLAGFLVVLFSADNIRPVAFLIFGVGYVSTMFRADYDQTNQTTKGLILIGWWIAFGVFPYLESLNPTLEPFAFWVLYALLIIGVFLEQTESGTTGVVVMAIAMIILVYLAGWGIRSRFALTPGSAGWWGTTPLVGSFVLLVLISWSLKRALSGPNRNLQNIAGLLSTWTGQFVLIGPLTVPVDTWIFLVLLWTGAIMAGINVLL